MSTLEQEITSLLKVNDKGWNINIFKDQNKMKEYLCAKCQSVCCNAVELGCDHKDEDVYVYCQDCLHKEIKHHLDKCPIDEHEDPIVSAPRY